MDDTAQFVHQNLPQDIRRHAKPPYLDPSVDPSLTDYQREDRLLARTMSPHVMVCLPASAYPTLEDSVPVFTEITEIHGAKTIEDIEALLEAVQAHLEPLTGPTGLYYSVRARTVQSSSNTPDRFLADLRELPALATTIEDVTETGTTRAESHLIEIVGSCLWPTEEGWFFLEANQGENEDTFGLHYGLLRHGPALDPTAITAFFEATTETPPNTQAFWPVQQLQLTGRYKPPVERLEAIDDQYLSRPDTGFSPLWFVGENPLFGVPQTATGLSEEELGSLYLPLKHVSSLAYESSTLGREPTDCHLKRIVAMQPPCHRTAFVTASVYSPRRE